MYGVGRLLGVAESHPRLAETSNLDSGLLLLLWVGVYTRGQQQYSLPVRCRLVASAVDYKLCREWI